MPYPAFFGAYRIGSAQEEVGGSSSPCFPEFSASAAVRLSRLPAKALMCGTTVVPQDEWEALKASAPMDITSLSRDIQILLPPPCGIPTSSGVCGSEFIIICRSGCFLVLLGIDICVLLGSIDSLVLRANAELAM